MEFIQATASRFMDEIALMCDHRFDAICKEPYGEDLQLFCKDSREDNLSRALHLPCKIRQVFSSFEVEHTDQIITATNIPSLHEEEKIHTK